MDFETSRPSRARVSALDLPAPLSWSGVSRPALPLANRLMPRFRGDVFRRRGGAFAEKVLFHLADNYFLVFAAGGIQAVFVQEHFAEFGPLIPGLLRDVVVDFPA